MKPRVDHDLCIGCGLCADVCSAVFVMDEDDGLAHVKAGADCEQAGCCEDAAEACPVDAITIAN